MDKTKIAFAKFIASGFYSGHASKAPGTCGTFVAALLIYLVFLCFPTAITIPNLAVLAIVTTFVGIWSCNVVLDNNIYPLKASSHKADPQQIVIDEFAGYYFSIIFLTPTLSSFIIAFIFFRIFDILKPPPIKQLESLPRGYGIMADDILAGIFAAAVPFICQLQ